ncbi:MAG: right-handed parallel beta-helix repeat-containing protein [Pirellulales bacterium]|nr:right-handed parallel beta-helix repeat-containing protein [Pirellulales bacterium]
MKSNTTFHVITIVLAVTICMLSAQTTTAAVQKTIHVSPSGDDKNPGTEAKPLKTIWRAQCEANNFNQNMTGDIEVILHDGTYWSCENRLSETIVFLNRHNGTGGHDVVYKAAAGATPVISGGKVITGWKADGKGRWKAPCGEHFRQLYVNGRRAVRARSPEATGKSTRWFDLGIVPIPGMEYFDENGYLTTDTAMADWRNPGDIELCYYVGWCHTRCKVDSIVRDGSHAIIRMVQPQFTLARHKEGLRAELPHYIENALELLDEPGEWYLDRADKMLYYKPLPGEKMNEVQVVVPVLETLVELRGLLDKPVEHIKFQGITFAHATWLRPSRLGMVDVQANFEQHMLNRMDRMGVVNNVHNEDLKSPANIVCRSAKNIHFERCTFTHLGGAGLDLEYGSSDNVVEGCHFHDISGSAIQVGGIERSDHHPGDKRTTVRNNQILNNLIENCAVEYMGGLGVFVGYTEATVIAHNEIRNIPYSGISMGWGWGEEDAGGGREEYYQPYKYDTPTTAKNNRIEYNHIHHTMQRLIDGGGIYTLGNMPGTVIQGNHIHDSAHAVGGIYLDEGSGFIEITGNLVYRVPKPMNYNNKPQNRKDTCKEHDNWFGDEFAKDADKLPEGAKKVVEKAGLQPEYQDLLKK